MDYGLEKVLVHEHPSDQTCHWVSVFKPFMFLVFHNSVLLQTLQENSYGKSIKPGMVTEAEYVKWLCSEGDGGLLNLVNLLLHVC